MSYASIFTREMAKVFLKEWKDRVLVIPEGIETLTEDFAFLFDETDTTYHFYEIDIPASVSAIVAFNLTEYPDLAFTL